jgi:hypothetical protein
LRKSLTPSLHERERTSYRDVQILETRTPSIRSRPMSEHAALRKQAAAKRVEAAEMLRIEPMLTLAMHRELVIRHAAELEADAVALDTRADGLERRARERARKT